MTGTKPTVHKLFKEKLDSTVAALWSHCNVHMLNVALTFHVHLGGLHDLLVDDKLRKFLEECRGGMDEHWLVHERSLWEKNRRRWSWGGVRTESLIILVAVLNENAPCMHSSISGPRCLLPVRAWQDDPPARPAQSAAGKQPGAQLVEPSSGSQTLPPPDTLCSLKLENIDELVFFVLCFL